MTRTGRTADEVDLVERYYKEQGLFRTDASPEPAFSSTLALDLATVEPSLAGPRRPQDRIELAAMKTQWRQDLSTVFKRSAPVFASSPQLMADEGGLVSKDDGNGRDPGFDGVEVDYEGQHFPLKHGAVVIAAITSCTNTSNPTVLIGAGLLARNAVAKGLKPKPWVKTSLAPAAAW